jgi:hypothetical protein
MDINGNNTENDTQTDQTQQRLDLLKSGFKAYVNPVKLPISAETKWMLEIVCLNEQPNPAQPKTVFDQARGYLKDQLFQMQTNITQNKQNWINLMKSN